MRRIKAKKLAKIALAVAGPGHLDVNDPVKKGGINYITGTHRWSGQRRAYQDLKKVYKAMSLRERTRFTAHVPNFKGIN